MTRNMAILVGIITLVMSPLLVKGQLLDPVEYTITQAPAQVKAGEVFTVEVSASIEGKWHLYSIHNDPGAGPYPTQFSSANSTHIITGKVTESEAVIEYDPNFDTDLGWHTSQASFTIPLAFKTDTEGDASINLEVLYQVCDDKSCLPPKKKKISGEITVAGVADVPVEGSVAGKSQDTGGRKLGENDPSKKVQRGGETGKERQAGAKNNPKGENEKQQEAISGQAAQSGLGSDGIMGFLWIALMAGFAALMTPCVFPMIPLTVSFFSKQKQGEGSSGKAVWQAVAFGVAIVLTFTILGALLAMIIGASGANKFAANPWVNLFIAAILVLFAVSLLGAFELRLPYRFTNWLNKKSNESSGIIGILFMALTISAVSFSCTAPFVGGVLAATTGGEWFYPILGMIGFSAAFASPFVLFALFPRWLESLPESGSWMNMVKVLLGFVELAAAFKFLSNADLVWGWGLVSRPLTISAWIAIFFMAGLYVLGVYVLHHDRKPDRIGTGRLFVAIPLFLFSFYLIPGLLGANLGIWDAWLPPKQSSDVSVVRSLAMMNGSNNRSAGELENWSDDYQASLKKARINNEPVFIDFTGYTCTNCRAMETNVFPLASIQERFEKMEKVRLYTDDGTKGPENQKFQFELTGTVALPTYVIVEPASGKVLRRLVGYTEKEKFQRFLDEGISRFRASGKGGVQLGIN